MRWRLKSTQFQKAKSKERRSKLQSLVQDNIPIGVMAYHQEEVAGWCSIAPRETYPLLESSTTLKRLDGLPVWSVVCFFVNPDLRKQNLPVQLLQAAAKYAFSQGATIVEGYPVEPDKSYRFMGSPSTFEKAGFQEAGAAKNGRKIVRLYSGK
jgi:GNAT superfamily N-acetyltransferase